ncbi:Phage-related baseplate assembly protein [Modicisalibacter ilicicola DSM 19980]|uniref:Phage-related baseplate assembly protein n=1 Tax=Modicisalibacter ilicicola DSM 19980 TaxID=1121942 RepID=A0A1M4Y4B4_9GAMM|nr:baseplate assembly protein [Halomonas ilicicola]SHF00322.1 Phage-related baseplate assembly protein [Halomonas ilicicola DSM 19980]
MSNPIDLSRLPAPDVVESLDYETILAERKAALVALYPADEQDAIAALLEIESEPLTKLCQENAYRELHWRQRVNEAAKAVMLAFSRDSDLDQLSANYNVERLTIDPGDPDAVPPVPATYESDDDLRLRAQRAFEGLSVAGPRGAYIFHALSADGRVADATAISPAPAEALVTVLSRLGDGTASQDLLDTVTTALSAEDVRPVGDRLTVQSAAIVNYSVDATLYVYPGPEQEPILAAAESALEAYVTTQRRIGRDIRLSALYAVLHVEGVQRVELAAPLADVVLDETQAAHCTGTSVVIGGIDE